MRCITNSFITNLENNLLQFRHSTSSSSAKLIFGAFSDQNGSFYEGPLAPDSKFFFVCFLGFSHASNIFKILKSYIKLVQMCILSNSGLSLYAVTLQCICDKTGV